MTEQVSTALGTCAVVVAGGTGERFGAGAGKQMALIGGRTVLECTVSAFDLAATIGHIVVVCHPDRVDEYAEAVTGALDFETPADFVAGGDTRTDSVMCGLAAVPEECDTVAVHDGARPLVTAAVIDTAVKALRANTGIDGVVVGHPMYDTLKATEDTRVSETVDRSRFWVAQTPQVFRVESLRDAYAAARDGGFQATDDAGYVERAGGVVEMIEGPRTNIKVTVAEDLEVARAVLASRESEETP